MPNKVKHILDMEEEPRKKKKEAPAAGWEIIYTSLVLILVALFAMLVSYSTIEGDKVTNFTRGFATTATTPGAGKMYSTATNSMLMEGGKEAIMLQSMASLQQYYKKLGLTESVHIEKTEKGFKATFGSNILFPSGVAKLNKNAYPYIDKMIEIAQQTSCFVKVEGHTDNVPIHTSEFSSNWELSTTRAVSVLRYLLEKGGLPAERLSAVGFSQYHPVASNATPEGRQKNRRVEFYFEL